MEKIIAWVLSIWIFIFGWLCGDKGIFAEFNYEKIADRTFGEIVEAIENQDNAKMKSLFSKNAIKEAKTLDKDIEELLDFIKGDIRSFSSAEDTGITNADTSSDNWKKKTIINSDYTLETDEEKYYLGIRQCIRDDFDRDNEGVTYICIINAKDWENDCCYVAHYENASGIIID